jgi:hypothetical protein
MNVVLLGKRQPNTRSLFANNEAGLAIDVGDRYGASESKRTWRRNLLTNSERFTAWTGGSSNVTANNETAPDGTLTASTINRPGGASYAILPSAVTFVPSTAYTLTLYIKAGTQTTAAFGVYSNTAGSFLSGTASVISGSASLSGTTLIQVTGLTSSWTRLQFTFTSASTGTSDVYFYPVTSGGSGNPASGTNIIWGFQLEQSSTPTDYQPITDFNTEFKAAYPTHSLYVDSNGVAPSVYPGDQVGLILDTARGGLDNLGPELLPNTGFSTDTVWSKSGTTISGGTANWTSAAGSSSVSQSAILTVGKFYLVCCDLVSWSSGTIRFRDGTTDAIFPNSSTLGKKQLIFRATGTNAQFIVFDASATLSIDNCSVREIPGNPVYQTTSGSRPALARTPDGGRRNLLTYSEQFDVTSGGWTKLQSSITANNSTAPDGTTTADLFVEDSASAARYVQQSLATTAQSYTFSCYFKQPTLNARRYVLLYHNESVKGWVFDIQNGVVGSGGTTAVGAPAAYNITSVGNGWYRCSITVTGTAATNNFRVYLVTNDGSGNASYTGDGVSGMLVWGAQVETGSSATAYQKVGLSSDVQESGKRDCWGLLFDGSDDSLLTASVNFSATDKMTVMAGVRKNSDAARATVCELTATIASNNGGFHLTAPNAASSTFAFESKGTSLTDAVATSIAAPATRVLTGIGDIAGDSTSLRVDGTVADTDTGDQGTGNYANAILYIGSRGGSSVRFNGLIYTLILRGAATPTGTISDFERNLLARRCGVTFGSAPAFSPSAVLLTSGASYTIPAGATTMKAWVVGGGGGSIDYSGGGGGCAFKTWTVAAGTVSYSVAVALGQYQNTNGGDTTCIYGGVTITGGGGKSQGNGRGGGTFSGGDGGANGNPGIGTQGVVGQGGSVGGAGGALESCGRYSMGDISGLKAALTLAGVSTTEGCACAAVFGSGAYASKYGTSPNCNGQGWLAPGIGGGSASWGSYGSTAGGGAVVLYFE